MAVVYHLSADENPPKGSDFVLIERTPDHRFRATPWAKGGKRWTPLALNSLDDAVQQASTWADDNDVPAVYVRAHP